MIEQTLGAVILAVAAVEGMINEIFAGAADGFPRRDLMGKVDGKSYARWAQLWNNGLVDRGLNALEKCQLALTEANLPPLPSDRSAVENMKALIALRN